MTTKAEEMVATLGRLRKRADEIEDAMRRLRLGAKVELADDRPLLRRIQWKGGVYGDGWLSQPTEPFPGAVSQDFYAFLRQRQDGLGAEIRALEAELEALAGPEVRQPSV